MPKFFDPTPEQRGELEAIAAAIPGVQKTFVLNHPHVKTPDRGAHQQQIAASKVLLTVADRLPPELDGLGVFQHTGYDEPLVGIGRISTGLGCPHAERHAGLGAVRIAAHVTAQTNRTVRSTSAYQQYWTGIVRARDVLGKFTFVPAADGAPAVSHGATRFTDDWRHGRAQAICRSISAGSRISTTAERQPRISPVRGPTITRSALGASPSRRPTSTRSSRS